LKEAVYGLPELHRPEITRARVVGNPGCFAVSCILGLAPALKESIIDENGIVCDAKTGVSGAGKRPNPAFHYPHRADNINAYRIGQHQHVLEIERELTGVSSKEIKITFTPHVVPMTRGILSTLYGRLKVKVSVEEILDFYKAFFRESPFVRVFGPQEPQQSCFVRGTNFCNLWINLDGRTDTLIVVSHIDNLVKGQAGNAVQNMNLMFGLEETMGLLRPSQYP
jgi:N-acetyl-gamma-glutamyl-phosphate reductase